MSVKTILECDEPDCSNEQTYDGPYHTIKEDAKDDGWTNRKIDDEWKLRCPECNAKKSR
jgi:hypothetical protein